MSNPDDVLRAGLKALVPYLKQFMLKHLEKKYGPEFREHLSRPGERPFSGTDPRSLIKVSLSEWEAAFRLDAPSQVKQYLHLLRDVANRHAHHDSVSADEVHHALMTMRLLATLIAGTQASSEFDRLLSRQQSLENAASGTRQPAVMPQHRESRRSDEALDPDLLDAQSAVNKRVLCPGCRVKVFKEWPKGWDAHAAFACPGVTQSDPKARKRDFRVRFAKLFRRTKAG